MKDYGKVSEILGINVEWKRNGDISLSQKIYAEQILREFKMSECRPQDTPLSPSIQLDETSSPLLDRNLHAEFRRIIGRLMFLAMVTRPDICFATNRLSQYLSSPRMIHLQTAKHLLRYIRATKHYSLTYRAKGRSSGLVGYADSGYGNSTQHRSTSAFVFMINSSPVSWSSRKQSIVAQSTTEAEYIALAEVCKQAIWMRHLLFTLRKSELCRKQKDRSTTLIYEDNQGSIKLASNPAAHTKTKHIQIRYHAIRDAIATGEVSVEYRDTGNMIADGLTKALSKEKVIRLVEALEMNETDQSTD